MTPVVSMRGISKSFAGNEVLHGVDFDIHAGSVHGLVGHNGAGKSTLMKALAGLYPDYTGEVRLDGSPARLTSPAASLAAGIAVIHQEFALIPAFRVDANLALGHEPTRRGNLDKREIRRRAQQLLDDLGFDLPLDVPVGELSVARQQLTEIAKALGRDARVLVMDEPTARLAPAEREVLFSIIGRLVARGVGVVYISHFLDEVLRVSDAVTVLRDGRVTASGPVADFTLGGLSRAITGGADAPSDAGGRAGRDLSREPLVELDGFGAVGQPPSSVTVFTGEIVGMAGLVGSGRTRLVEAVCGARPHAGVLRVGGESVDFRTPADAADAGVVGVPEDRKTRGLVPRSSVADNISLTALGRLFASFGFVRRAEQRRAVAQSIQRYDIGGTDGGAALVSSLSGGNQQKVLIARVAVAEPRVLVLDQPTAGVDISAKGEIYRHIRSLAADGVACLVVSDELDELLALCDRIAIVRRGQITDVFAARELNPARLLELMSSSQDRLVRR